MKAQLSVALCAILGLSACATATRGTRTAWEVTSTPVGARVETSNGYSCAQTPCSIKMPRRSTFVATLSLPGYQNGTVNVTNKMSNQTNAMIAGSAVLGGLLAVSLDASTGALLDLTPNPSHVDLTALYRTMSAAPTPATTAAMNSNLVTHYSDYLDQVTADVQNQTRSLLATQSGRVADQHRADIISSFDRSVETSSSFIRQGVVRVIAANTTSAELENPEVMTAERITEMRGYVEQSQRGITATLVRSAWVRACTDAGPAMARDCSVYMSAAEGDISRFESDGPQV